MKKKITLLAKSSILLLLSNAVLVLASCEKDKTNGSVIPPEEYVYIDDNYDNGISPEKYVADYKGVPYQVDPEGKSPLVIAGTEAVSTVEVEDFDDGGTDISFSFREGAAGNYKDYRAERGVAISKNDSQIIHVGNVNGGDWLSYTLEVAEAGTYSIETFCVCPGGKSKFYFEVDGKSAGEMADVPDGDWGDLSGSVVVKGVQLSAGKHILRWSTASSVNADRFVFTHTGEYTGIPAPSDLFKYPMYGTYQNNPLFVNFPSQMYRSSFVGTLYTADPSAHVWEDGRLYVYASHDMEPTQGCDRMDRYHAFSTADLISWTDHGEIMNAATVKEHTGLGIDGFMWAPDCAYNKENQTYYLFFPHKTQKDPDVWGIFVATSKEPAAKFKVQGVIEGVPSIIDPCVFVDDDGQAYIYVGGGGECWGGKLKRDDWTKLDSRMEKQLGVKEFHEAPWVHKYKNYYYLSHSDNHSTDKGGNQMRYSRSKGPLGPWVPFGIYMYPHGHETAHGSIVQFNGSWYSFYHTANYSAQGALRSVCVDLLEYTQDDHLKVVQNWGAPYNGTPVAVGVGEAVRIEAEEFNKGGEHAGYHKKPSSAGMDIADGYIKGMKGDEWVRYSINVNGAGRYDINCNMSQSRSGSKFIVVVNGIIKTQEIELKSVVGSWGRVPISLELQAGEQYLEFRIKNGDINMDWFEFGDTSTQIPAVIEAEDFDDGGDGVSFHFADQKYNNDYREEQKVSLNKHGDGLWHIGNTSGGDWFNYTFSCKTGGKYDLKLLLASNQDGRFSISIDDGAYKSGEIAAGTDDWQGYEYFIIPAINLSVGKHIMTFHIVTALNFDKLEFVKSN